MAVSITCSPAGEIPASQFAEKTRPDYILSHTVSASTNTQTNNQNWSVTNTDCTAVTYSYYNNTNTVVGGGTDLTSTLTITPGTTSVISQELLMIRFPIVLPMLIGVVLI